jgi:hypothetical protein
MSNDIQELKMAVEKLIELIGHHESVLSILKTLVDFHSTKLEKLSKIDALDARIQSLESRLVEDRERSNRMESRLGLVEIDATSDHQLDGHNQDVVRDWMMEHDAGINTDMIPFTNQDVKERYAKYLERKKH